MKEFSKCIYPLFTLLFFFVSFSQLSGMAGIDFQGCDSLESLSTIQGNPSSSSSNGKTLVILMGSLRGGDVPALSLEKNVLIPNDADLAIMVMNDMSDYPSSAYFDMAKYIWFFKKYHDWAPAVDMINGTSWRDTHLPEMIKYRTANLIFGGLGRGTRGSGVIIFMIRWFVVQKLLEFNLLDKYEKFIVTRTDHYYSCPHDISVFDFSNNTIWVPEGEDYGGITDRHLVVHRDNILDALDIMPEMIRGDLGPFIYNATQFRGTETWVKTVWDRKHLRVKRFRRSMYTTGTSKDKSWKRFDGEVPGFPGLFIKYGGEYALTKATVAGGCLTNETVLI